MFAKHKDDVLKELKPVQQTLYDYFQVIKPENAKNIGCKSQADYKSNKTLANLMNKQIINSENDTQSRAKSEEIMESEQSQKFDLTTNVASWISPGKRNSSNESCKLQSPSKKIRSASINTALDEDSISNHSKNPKSCCKNLLGGKEDGFANEHDFTRDLYLDDSSDTVDLSQYGIHRNDLTFTSNIASPCEQKVTPSSSKQNHVFRVIDSVTGHIRELRRLPFPSQEQPAPHRPQKPIKIENIDLENIKPQPDLNQSKQSIKNEIIKAENTVTENSFIVETFLSAWNAILENSLLFRALNRSEQSMLAKLFDSPPQDQKLCLHLFSYLPKWYQLGRFTTKIHLEVTHEDLEAMMTRLESQCFVKLDYKNCESLESQLNILTQEDIKLIAKRFRLKSAKRAVLIERIVNYARFQTSIKQDEIMEDAVKDAVHKQLGVCVLLDASLRKALFRLLLLNFFPLRQFASVREYFRFFAEIKNETITLPFFHISVDFDIFPSSSSFESFADATASYFEYLDLQSKMKVNTSRLMELAMKAIEQLQLQSKDAAKCAIRMRFTAEHVYVKLVTQACKDFSKSHTDIVVEWLNSLLQQSHCAYKRGEWYEELLKHTRKERQSEVISRGLADPGVNFCDKCTLSARGLQCIKRKRVDSIAGLIDVPSKNAIRVVTVTACPIAKNRIGKRILYRDSILNGNFLTVEEVAMRHYGLQQYAGIHCEGDLVKTLFTVLFWDIIYAQVPGAFINSMQFAPLDLYTEFFYINRKQLIDDRLNNIAKLWPDKELFNVVAEWLDEHSHKLSLHSPTIANTPNLIVEAITCITRAKLARILARFVKDIRQYQSGMPDLFLWNVATKKCIFAEVKSEKDTLSMKQKLWMQFLREEGLATEECRVRNDDSGSD